MTAAVCSRHPDAATHAGHCAACLIEQALVTSVGTEPREIARCVIKVPLGDSPKASVFVVESPAGLRRLKQWHSPAPPGFLNNFHRLKRRLDDWRPALVALPVEVSVDDAGRPSILSEFRQGMPLFECVAAGQLTSAEAVTLLEQFGELLRSAHERGLVHGSVAPGNIIVTRDRTPSFLDFGVAALLAPPSSFAEGVRRDLDDYARRAVELDDLARS
jgi:hypothetical protein